MILVFEKMGVRFQEDDFSLQEDGGTPSRRWGYAFEKMILVFKIGVRLREDNFGLREDDFK